jgi:hypothetical protein
MPGLSRAPGNRPGTIAFRRRLSGTKHSRSAVMPIILWLLGVPLTVVVLLMLTHVI